MGWVTNGAMKTERLLTRSTRAQLLFTALLLLIAAPGVYLVTRALYLEETDETLRWHKAEFLGRHPGFRKADIAPWNAYNRNVQILPFDGNTRDTLYTRTYYDTLEQEAEPYREFRSPVRIEGTSYTYFERTNLIEQEELVAGLSLLFLLMAVLLAGGILLLNRWLSARIWKPFYHTIDEMERFELDKNLVPTFPPTGISEFDRLNRSVGMLIGKSQAAYAAQKEFIANAAHELQTPLAVFQGRLDTLIQTELTEAQSALLGALARDVSRLNRLNRNLLLLSRIDHGSYPAAQAVSMGRLLERNLEFFREQAQEKQLQLELRLLHDPVVRAHPALAEVLLNNLMLNAIRHNVVHGSIRVTTDLGYVLFENTGAASPLDPARMFNRFSKGAGKGNGLGLAIVRRIAEVYGWEVGYAHHGLWHSFTVRFPVQD